MPTPRSVTAAEMREIDRRAIEDYGIPSLILMENAGRCAADVAGRMVAAGSGAVMIFCGKGSNGGDGLVVARHLANRGYDVRVYCAVPPEEIAAGSDAGVNLAIARKMGIPMLAHGRTGDPDTMARRVPEVKLFVDGLLGTGLAGEVRPPFTELIDFLNARRAPVLSLDLPSGLDADRGVPLGRAVKAKVTVTFGAPKKGFDAPGADRYTGKVVVAEISIPRVLFAADALTARS